MIDQHDQLKSLSDEQLALRCGQRPVDQAAWYEFYIRFYDFVHRVVRRVLRLSQAEVDEVVQEAFTRIFQILPTYDPAKALVKTYVSRVVRNLTIDVLRHGSLNRSLSVTIVDEIDVQDRQTGAIERLASEIVDSLPDSSKVPMLVDIIRGESVKDVCRKYGKSQYEVYDLRTWLRTWLLTRKTDKSAK